MDLRFLSGHTKKSVLKSLGMLLFAVLFYCMSISVSFAQNIMIALLGGIIAGFPIGQLFIIGHDAAHNAYVETRIGNAIIARISFFLSLHHHTLWVVMHNRYHHGCLSLKGEDDVWPPMSLEEYHAASPWRRRLERFYRGSPLGNGAWYIVETWLKGNFMPWHPRVRQQIRRHLPDAVLTFAAIPLQLGGLYVIGTTLNPDLGFWRIFLVSWILPFLVWNVLMGTTTFLHHTHPRVRWYGTREEWTMQQAALESATRVSYPDIINPVFYNINEHSAHHLRPAIPIYRLRKAQRALEAAFPGRVTVVKNAFREYLAISRACKLYDYENHRWLDFNGNPTSGVTGPAAESAGQVA